MLEYRYDTQLLIEGENLDEDEISDYADYMIASEETETEPGLGWYYTDWLTALSEDTSMPTLSQIDQVDLIFIFDQDNPCGYIAGARTDYDEEETQMVARGLTELAVGDRLEFLCDYYSYDGQFQDNYYLGEPMTVEEEMVISNVDVSGGELRATYRVTDIYNVHYWMPPME